MSTRRHASVRWAVVFAVALSGATGAIADEGAAASSGPDLPEPVERLARGVFAAPVRYRHEYRDDFDLRDDRDDDDNIDLLKLNFGVDARPVDALRGRVALRYTRSWGRNTVNKNAKIDPLGQDQVDLFEAFGEVGPVASVPLSVRLGRQTLKYGDERLVGVLEWVQNSRSWDGATVVFAGDGVQVDAWWGRRVLFEGPDDHNFNHPVDTIDFFGAYGSLKVVPGLVLEPYYLVKFDDNATIVGERGRAGHHLLRHSPGLRFVIGAPAGFTLDQNVAVQYGDRGPDDIFAFGTASKLVWAAPEMIRPLLNLEVEYIFGSGDGDPTDGDTGTFDNYYPTNHKYYGEIDFASWQNIHDVELTLRLELVKLKLRDPPRALAEGEKPPLRCPLKKIPDAVVPATLPVVLETGYHFFWLAEAEDAWYNAAPAPVRRDPTGRAGRDLGNELDLVLRAGPLAVGYGHFFPGTFIERTTPAGGDASGTDFVYAQVDLAF